MMRLRVLVRVLVLMQAFFIQLRAYFRHSIPHGCPKKNSVLQISEKTKEYFLKLDKNVKESSGAGGSSSLAGLERLESSWAKLRNGSWSEEPQIIVDNTKDYIIKNAPDDGKYDFTIIGGNLGIFYALALQMKGYRTCVIERFSIRGRSQEWNISKKELDNLVKIGILTDEEMKSIISIEFNPVRVGFNSDTSPGVTQNDIYVKDVLNIGVKPDTLIEMTKNKFLAAGGCIRENIELKSIDVYANVAEINVLNNSKEREIINSNIVIDCMGNQSPITRQIRGTIPPDSITIVVGTCARGYDSRNNTYSDLIYTDSKLKIGDKSSLQYFWEAFPCGTDPSDRTTYLFTYLDAKPERPSIGEIFDDYWELLPRYQGVDIDKLDFLRILYGYFPTYRESPLVSPFNRILAVGDASGIQSPLSFGGFGSLTRHISRITNALDEAAQLKLYAAKDLSLINAYQPSLSIAWMFQLAMSVRVNSKPMSDTVIVDTLSNMFRSMSKLGDETLMPFLQDVLMFHPLFRTLLNAAGQDLLTPIKTAVHVGVLALADFTYHFMFLFIFTVLHNNVSAPLLSVAKYLPLKQRYVINRLVDQWKFGSGLDYYDH